MISALESQARAELALAKLMHAYYRSPATRYALQEADEYFDALLEMTTPREPSRERRIPPVGIPHVPSGDDLEIARLQARIAALTGELASELDMARTAYDDSYVIAPRARDRKPASTVRDQRTLPRAEYVPASESSPSPARIRQQANAMRHERNAAQRRNSKKGS